MRQSAQTRRHHAGARATSTSHAFTLVELLVVIGIIAVLIGILLPALNAARRSSNSLYCQSNLRTIGQSIQLYAVKYRGSLPYGQVSIDRTNNGGGFYS